MKSISFFLLMSVSVKLILIFFSLCYNFFSLVSRHGKYSSARRASPNGRAELSAEDRKGNNSVERKPVVSLRSPQRDVLDRSEGHGKPRKLSPSMEKSPVGSDASRGRSDSEERRFKCLPTHLFTFLDLIIYFFLIGNL